MTWLGDSDAKRSSVWGGGATFCAAGVRAATANELVRTSLVCAATLVTAAFTRSTAATATALVLVRVVAAGAGAATGRTSRHHRLPRPSSGRRAWQSD